MVTHAVWGAIALAFGADVARAVNEALLWGAHGRPTIPAVNADQQHYRL